MYQLIEILCLHHCEGEMMKNEWIPMIIHGSHKFNEWCQQISDNLFDIYEVIWVTSLSTTQLSMFDQMKWSQVNN